MRTAFIYGLRCPLTGEIRYVGKCENPKKRFPAHLCTEETCYRGNWIRSLKAQGLKPAFEILAKVPNDNWEFWERSYIRAYRCLGFDLVNGTDGGEGFGSREKNPMFGGGAKCPAFGKKGKQSPSFGLKRSPDFCARVSESLKGIKRSPEFCAILGARTKGNLYNLAVKRKSNTSGFVGVSWYKRDKNWRARIKVNNKEINLGYFSKIEDAVFVRNLAFDKYYGNN